jgi:murein DD-endopeptidase MepM/ murein hydrolase activator NlpD
MKSVRLVLPFVVLVTVLTAACAGPASHCPIREKTVPVDLARFASDPALPFRFPLASYEGHDPEYHAWFSEPADVGKRVLLWHRDVVMHHAAEDYRRPAGTPVLAMADGRVSFSGRAGGYGWLVIVDHPQANLYSLYGHLSPSRWRIGVGPVRKGQLLAYLGDPDENGGSQAHPLDPHLHLGLRAGQRADYPAKGEWRFMAGWIRACPADLGWLRPSAVINGQAIPAGGFPSPAPTLLDIWGLEITVTAAYSAFALGVLLAARRRKAAWPAFVPAALLGLAWLVLHRNGLLRTNVLLGIAVAMLCAGVFVRRAARRGDHPAG